MQNKYATLNEIRQNFLNYFKKNNHKIMSSSSLVPENDPTLLFTNAGMVQFKDYFTGKKKAPFPCVTTAQKCVRAGGKHNDLENVGYTARHHTFFEMLGNFSFGDYFKEQAIEYAWEIVTKVFCLEPKRLCVTVFSEDEEAARIWKKITGFSDSKIIRIATADNFWSMGNTGPCGPCTEIFYDHGEDVQGGMPGSSNEDGDRFTEIWNLVFMQYEQKEDGLRMNLPHPCIDTGMGLERIAAVLQNKHNNFEIDLFEDLINEVREKTKQKKGEDQSCHVIVDHIRSISFLIADGVLPLNEGRGYVLRRIIRRAVRHARILGAQKPILYQFVDKLVHLMGDQYPELLQRKSLIQSVLQDEEDRFGVTLDRGLKLVDESIQNLVNCVLPGDTAFKLYDTYGFPIDLTADILKQKGLSLDWEGFEKEMQKQKDLSKKSDQLGIKTSSFHTLSDLESCKIPETLKKCYENIETTSAKILFIQRTNERKISIILDKTPFFAESGGQVGDTGILQGHDGELLVLNTYSIHSNGKVWVIHEGTLKWGNLNIGDKVLAKIDFLRRKQISAHHSATHILQAALREILGTHVTQKGSFVDENRLRFDFTHPKELSDKEKEAVEALINSVILSACSSQIIECSKEEALTQGALAFFDEKYEQKVRVVQIAKQEGGVYFSQELCGGTHVSNTGEIGLFKILNESSIAAGIRRIEAVCGKAFLKWIEQTHSDFKKELTQLKEDHKCLLKQLHQMKAERAVQDAKISTEICGSFHLVIHKMQRISAQQARDIALELQKNLSSGVLIVTSIEDEKVVFIVGVSFKDQHRISAHHLVQLACQKLNGKGGGKVNIAQGGGINKNGLEEAIEVVRSELRKI